MAHKSWLDIMADDSNLSMASIQSMQSIQSITSKDPEFDNSKQGVNLLFNKNVQIICDDSKSRKRTFKEMESQQTEYQQIESNKENEKFLPPKAKQRTNVNGDWKKRKNENNKIGFGRFLNWANNDNLTDNKSNNNKILKNKLNDNERNICHIINNRNNGNIDSKSNSKLIICASSINQNRARRRKQIRSRKINKKNVLNIDDENDENDENDKNHKNHKNDKNVEKFNMTKIIEQEQEKETEINQDITNDIDVDIDVDIDIVDEPKKSLNDQNINNKIEEKEEKEENIDDNNSDNEEDDDLKINNIKKIKQRRITPILENVVFDANLILNNKVPILKQKPMNDVLNGPIFLNADQFEKLHKKSSPNIENKENEDDDEDDEDDEDDDVWSKNSLIKIKNNNKNNNKTENWANKLFGEKIKENKKLKEKEEEIMINERKKEIKHEIKIESLLPTKCVMFSRESSVSINTDSCSTPTTITTTTTTTICNKPSLEATEWREKQILIGKNTIGYKNFIKKYPNKEIKYRISNKFLSTPDSKDKVGKKRWVGKYQKWRKFLHFFDNDDCDNDCNNDCDDVENKTNDKNI